jgi:hypothetical protein
VRWRRTQNEDIPAVRSLWESAGYGFPFPDLADAKIVSSWIAEEEGKIVCWSGALPQPEIISIMDASWGSPHRRMAVFAGFHARMWPDLIEKGYSRAFCTVDPKHPKFARRLLKAGLGWFAWWPTLWITREAFTNENPSQPRI